MEEAAPYPRFLSHGRCFAYVLPCRFEDLLKVGFTRDPLRRLHALHRRYFDFFDLDRALLIEVPRVREARAIERTVIVELVELRAPAPLVVRRAAGGHTEWYRGAAAAIDVALPRLLASSGGQLHAPLRHWLRSEFQGFSDQLWQWSLMLIEAVEYEAHNLPSEAQRGLAASSLRHVLDSCVVLDFDLSRLVPARVLDWYANAPLFERR